MKKIFLACIGVCLLIATSVPVIFPPPAFPVSESEAIELQGRAYALLKEGKELEKQGQFQAALSKYEAALQLFQSLDNREQVAWCQEFIGSVKSSLQDVEGSHQAWQASLKIWQEHKNRPMQARLLSLIGSSLEKQGQIESAIAAYQQSIAAVESLINDVIRGSKDKEELADILKNPSNRLINLLWGMKRDREAFNYVEQAKSRTFLDQLNHGSINFRTGTDGYFLEKEKALVNEIALMRERRHNEPDDEAIKTKLAEYADLQSDRQILSPELRSLQRVDAASLEEIQGFLDADTSLVEYFVTEKRTLAFVITRNTFKSVALEVGEEALRKPITAFFRFPKGSVPHPENLKKLYQFLFAPLQPYLTTRTIGIVPHGVLHYLPFAALTDGKRYVSDDRTLFVLPNASVLRFLPKKRKPSTGTVLAIANQLAPGLPDLKRANSEAQAIAQMYNTQPLLGKDATESAVWSKAGEAEILHLAAHGQFKLDNPIFSTIYLRGDGASGGDAKTDGRLEVHEIYELDLTKATNLVVLSACQMQEGKLKSGDEVVAMNRAFLYAGTPSIIASLWTVHDEATALLMQRFYQHLRSGKNKAEALQQAQIELRQQPGYRLPYFWGAFVLTGLPN